MQQTDVKKISAFDVASYIINYFKECEDPITNLKLQKMLYYTQGWWLGLYGEPLFNEDFQAWVHGPVVPEVYRKYKENKWNPIVEELSIETLPNSVTEHVDEVIKEYGGISGVGLEIMTHREYPWINARGNIAETESCTNIVTKKDMQIFFKEKNATADTDEVMGMFFSTYPIYEETYKKLA